MVSRNMTKEQWTRHYSLKVLQSWTQIPSPFSIDSSFSRQIETYLADYYDEPLKKDLIESTY